MKITKFQLRRIIKEEYALVEAEEDQKNKVQIAYGKIKAMHVWVMKPENAWIRKIASKMLGEKDLPEKEEVKDAKVQAEGYSALNEKKGEGVMAAYKKLKGMYSWVMGDENKWAREIVIDMLNTGDMPEADEVKDGIKSSLPDNALMYNGAYHQVMEIDRWKVGDESVASGRTIEDVEKTDGNYIFLMDDSEIETYAPSPDGGHILVKESSALRHRRIYEAHKKLHTRRIIRESINKELIQSRKRI
jgi:hypothetical protein